MQFWTHIRTRYRLVNFIEQTLKELDPTLLSEIRSK